MEDLNWGLSYCRHFHSVRLPWCLLFIDGKVLIIIIIIIIMLYYYYCKLDSSSGSGVFYSKVPPCPRNLPCGGHANLP